MNSYVDDSPITFYGGFKLPVDYRLTNNGHGIQLFFDYADDIQPNITGGPLGDNTYIFDHLHIHWVGSEHMYNRRIYFAEMHLVHFNSLYGSIEHAKINDDGLAVLGLMYSFNSNSENNLPFSEALNYVTEPYQEYTEADPAYLFSYAEVLKQKSFNVASYLGSLTTPPYCENVIWMLAEQPLSINEKELEALKSILDSHGHHITSNIRPLQKTNSRTTTVFNAFMSDDRCGKRAFNKF